MIFLRLFYEFFKVGLFSIGGGLATVPFLSDMSLRTGWFTPADLADMIAVAESTPGPLGVNMASYVGFTTAGPVGCIIASLGLVAPSIVVILIIARVLARFRSNRYVDGILCGLRPASTGLIAAALITVAQLALFSPLNWGALGLAVVVFVCLQSKPLKKVHPIVFIALSAAAGVLFQL